MNLDFGDETLIIYYIVKFNIFYPLNQFLVILWSKLKKGFYLHFFEGRCFLAWRRGRQCNRSNIISEGIRVLFVKLHQSTPTFYFYIKISIFNLHYWLSWSKLTCFWWVLMSLWDITIIFEKWDIMWFISLRCFIHDLKSQNH